MALGDIVAETSDIAFLSRRVWPSITNAELVSGY